MTDLVNMIVNNGIAVVVVAYFLYTNFRFNEKLTTTLTEITITLKDIQDDIKRGDYNDNTRYKESDKSDNKS